MTRTSRKIPDHGADTAGQFMLAVARLRLNEGNALLGTESMEATRKGASHFSKMLVVES